MAQTAPLPLVPGHVSLPQLHGFWRKSQPVSLDPAAWPAVEAAAGTVAEVLAKGERVYGINTGFGLLARQSIETAQVTELQRRLVLSHMAGTGPRLPARVVRMVLLLKAAALARGHSGVRRQVIDSLLALISAEALPVIPRQGSVGASGDLAPLAALSAALIGEGRIELKGDVVPAASALERIGLRPIELAAKEGLALLNGTQVSTALALDGLFRCLDVFAAALIAGAMSVDAALGSDIPFDPRIQKLRGQPGQSRVAAWLRDLLADSEIRKSHLECDRVQDPYSLRCQPQVMGAAFDVAAAAAGMIAREANAVTDNPLVFSDTGEVLSGGNFHAEPVAMAADMLAIALAEIGALSERRVALLVDENMSSLPAFLVAEPGLNSGFMIAQVTAAALASENKSLAHPASVDSLPTSANQEDHVSMATYAARRLGQMARNVDRIVAIELLAAAQGLDFRAPLKSGSRLLKAHSLLRTGIPTLQIDRPFTPDIEATADLIRDGSFFDLLWPEAQAQIFAELGA
jgi:histidine ammonia-lyase